MTTPNQLPIDRAFVIGGDTADANGLNDGVATSYPGNNFGQNFAEDGIRSLFEIPAFGLANMVEVFTQLLLKLPLEALNKFGAVIPGFGDGFTDVATGVAEIVGSLTEVVAAVPMAVFQTFLDLLSGNPGAVVEDVADLIKNGLESLTSLVQSLLGIFGIDIDGSLLDQIFDLSDAFDGLLGDTDGLLSGFSDLSGSFEDMLGGLFTAFQGGVPDLGGIGGLIGALPALLSNIPTGNVLGVGGPADIGGSIIEFLDQLVGGFVGTVGTGAGFSDVFNVGQEVSGNAFKGFLSFDILGIRNNKSFSTGMLPTSTSSLPLTQVASGSSPTTFGVTSTTAITLYERVSESALCGAVRWMGSGVSNITGFFLNIYKMDPASGDRECIYTSGDIKGDLSGTMTTNKHVLSTAFQREPGEIYGYELALTGTGTHTVVGEPTWIHDDPDIYPRRMSSVRSGGSVSVGTVQSSGSITYASNIPFIEVAVTLDAVDIPHSPETVLFNTVQSGTTLPIPSWANTVEVIVVGGGGGGHIGGTWGVSGKGGDAGQWGTDTWVRGTDFSGSPSISITTGAGGSSNSGDGSSSSASITGHSVSGSGGQGADDFSVGGNDKNGDSPGNQVYGGVTYVGGGTQSTFGGKGAAPGGAGAGGNFVSFQSGGAGAPGAVWIRFKQ